MDDSYYVYKLLKLRGVGPILVNKILGRLSHIGVDVSKALGEPPETDELRQWLDDRQIKLLAAPDSKLRAQVEQLEGQDARFICAVNGKYPRSLELALQDSKPPVLSCLGNLQLLEMPCVGFCGSRKPSHKGLDIARDCVEQLVKHGFAIVSGYAGGVDRQVHLSALQAGGATIVVLPEGLLNFSVRTILRRDWDWSRVLVVSEFLPDDVWRASRAMQRNKTIIGLSRAMVLVEAGAKGGTVDAGKRTLDLGRRLYVIEYDDMAESPAGNKLMLERGATPLLKSRRTGRANVSPLVEAVKGFRCSDTGLPRQLTFP